MEARRRKVGALRFCSEYLTATRRTETEHLHSPSQRLAYRSTLRRLWHSDKSIPRTTRCFQTAELPLLGRGTNQQLPIRVIRPV